MKKIILIGPVGCGKSTLCRMLNGLAPQYKKTQAVEVVHTTIDTPGEYLENYRYISALAVSAMQAEVVVIMQSCTDQRGIILPGFSGMFGGKTIYGVVSKTDLAQSEEQIARAQERLRLAGVANIFQVNCTDPTSVNAFHAYLEDPVKIGMQNNP